MITAFVGGRVFMEGENVFERGTVLVDGERILKRSLFV